MDLKPMEGRVATKGRNDGHEKIFRCDVVGNVEEGKVVTVRDDGMTYDCGLWRGVFVEIKDGLLVSRPDEAFGWTKRQAVMAMAVELAKKAHKLYAEAKSTMDMAVRLSDMAAE